MCESGQVIGASGLSASTLPRARRGTIWARCLKLGANTRATAPLPYYLHELSAFRERFLACGETALPPSPALRVSRAVAFACAMKARQIEPRRE
jgi:hypothetical protein